MAITLRYIVSLISSMLLVSLLFYPINDVPNSMQLSFFIICVMMSKMSGLLVICSSLNAYLLSFCITNLRFENIVLTNKIDRKLNFSFFCIIHKKLIKNKDIAKT